MSLVLELFLSVSLCLLTLKWLDFLSPLLSLLQREVGHNSYQVCQVLSPSTKEMVLTMETTVLKIEVWYFPEMLLNQLTQP